MIVENCGVTVQKHDAHVHNHLGNPRLCTGQSHWREIQCPCGDQIRLSDAIPGFRVRCGCGNAEGLAFLTDAMPTPADAVTRTCL